MLGISIVSRRYLDDVRADEVQPVQSTEDCAKFTGRPATSLGGTGSRGNYVDILLELG